MSDIAIDVAREVVDNDLDMGEKKEDGGSVYFSFVVWGLIISIAMLKRLRAESNDTWR